MRIQAPHSQQGEQTEQHNHGQTQDRSGRACSSMLSEDSKHARLASQDSQAHKDMKKGVHASQQAAGHKGTLVQAANMQGWCHRTPRHNMKKGVHASQHVAGARRRPMQAGECATKYQHARCSFAAPRYTTAAGRSAGPTTMQPAHNNMVWRSATVPKTT